MTIDTVLHIGAILAFATTCHVRALLAFFTVRAVAAERTVDTVITIGALELFISMSQKGYEGSLVVWR
jgi:hypothetical protein